MPLIINSLYHLHVPNQGLLIDLGVFGGAREEFDVEVLDNGKVVYESVFALLDVVLALNIPARLKPLHQLTTNILRRCILPKRDLLPVVGVADPWCKNRWKLQFLLFLWNIHRKLRIEKLVQIDILNELGAEGSVYQGVVDDELVVACF